MSLAVPERSKGPEPASQAQVVEMRRLLEKALRDTKPATLSEAISKRAWLKRGIAATEAYASPEECPEVERPFYEYFDGLHRELLRRMLALAEERSGAWTAYQTFLERLWKPEYGRHETGAGGGTTVILIERPPRADGV